MTINLNNVNVLVTGASRGIGKAIATQLAAAGARVAIHYNKSEDLALALADKIGNDSMAFQADLAVPIEVLKLYDDVIRKFKHLDVLVNNAGVAIESDPKGDDIPWIEDWVETINVNLNAPALLCKKAIEHFITRKGGRIINISSRAAFRGDTEHHLAYAASKGGLVSLTKSIARDFGKSGVKAFNVAPGFVKTEMAKKFAQQFGEEYIKNDIVLNRLTEPDDIAPMVVFLASGLADHATGTTIDMNAGSYLH